MSSIDMHQMPLDRLVNVVAELFVADQLHEKEYSEARDKARARVMRAFLEIDDDDMGYDYSESYGSPSDDYDAPLPYLNPTEQTDTGYVGLDPPLN